ncbi:hypothetical protein P154DRAFT_438053 [Amniculicola lignicola CBS 123094]|uniref:Uncharacterized protein n=1 Tax=Amniculicola lignicola CBS 123094 TaxID=1392246 RepID=A0A6A5WDL2_9PLEO|nr:hypothetical protein P154DRAFT_438053 [Amniculicola lignicola CBS 123094]
MVFAWPTGWIVSGAPILIYALLVGKAKGYRVLPFVPLWSIFATVNLAYAICATSWLLYWVFAAVCWPALVLACLFQFDFAGRLLRRSIRKTFLRELHFIRDQVAFFDLPALEIDTDVKGLFVIRGVTLSLSTLTLVVHGVEVGVKLSDDIELAIQTDKVVVPLFREIQVDDIYANVKGGEWEVTFGDIPFGKRSPHDSDDDDDGFIVRNTAILLAASKRSKPASGRPDDMATDLTSGAAPANVGDAKTAFSSVTQISPNEEEANIKYQAIIRDINETSAIAVARKRLMEAEHDDQEEHSLDLDCVEDVRAAICAEIHSDPSIPHPPRQSIRVSALAKTSYPGVKKFLHRLPFLYRLMLFPICYFHPVQFKSITAAGSGKWFVHLMRKHFFKHYTGQDAEIRRLEARITAWCTDANFAVEFGPFKGFVSFPINTKHDIECNVKIADVMAYRALPDAAELKQVVRLGGADAVVSIPMFMFPHHEHIIPPIPSEFDIMEKETEILEAEGTPQETQAKTKLEQLKKDEANMHISAHAHLPARFNQDLLNFIAALVKATKVIETDKTFEEEKALREIRRVGSIASNDSEKSDNLESDVSSLASATTPTQSDIVAAETGFKGFMRKMDTGFRDATSKTRDGMRKAGVNTVSAMANDRWIASLVGKTLKKVEKMQGELGYSTDVPLPLSRLRQKAETESKLLP